MDLSAMLAPHYTRFRVAERLLLTGHSHQAWPDVALQGQIRAWEDAARFVDDKWEHAERKAARVRSHWQRLLGDQDGSVALGQNTHELVTRLLSALPLTGRPRLVTSTGEFHTLTRQLARLAETGVEVVWLPAEPADTLAERLAAAVDPHTACALVSSVLFETAQVVPNLAALTEACERHGAALLVDAYHHLNVLPFDIRALGLSGAFVTGGGYKYCQLGEGNGFLRVPPDTHLRPLLTGWYASFDTLQQAAAAGRVSYPGGAGAFAGATYDPTAHYRAVAVFDFHIAMGLTPERLRAVSRHQVGLLQRSFEALGVDPAVAHVVPMPAERRGGFLALRCADAAECVAALRRRGVWADSRGQLLRLGPAPYLSDRQLSDAVGYLGDALGSP